MLGSGRLGFAPEASSRRTISKCPAAAAFASGVPEPAAQQILEVFAALRRGAYATTTDAVALLTNRPARRLSDLLTSHLPAFADLVTR